MRLIAALILLCLASPARAEPFPHLTCPVVRELVQQHGKAKALALAIRYGATWQQIRLARKCLK